ARPAGGFPRQAPKRGCCGVVARGPLRRVAAAFARSVHVPPARLTQRRPLSRRRAPARVRARPWRRASSLPSLPSSFSSPARAGAFRTSSLAWPLVLLAGGVGFFGIDPEQGAGDAQDFDLAAGAAERLDVGGGGLVGHRGADVGLARDGDVVRLLRLGHGASWYSTSGMPRALRSRESACRARQDGPDMAKRRPTCGRVS